MRIAIGGIVHETNTYADAGQGQTGIDHFFVTRGAELIDRNRGTQTAAAGMIAAAAELGAEVVPTMTALAWPSGTITADAYADLKAELLRRIEDALPVDALVLDLHGAGSVAGTPDLEGDLGRALRDLVGPDLPITAALDLHGNITDTMAEVYDALFGVHLYPHTDFFERGEEAVYAAARMVVGELHPVTHVEHLPILLPPATTDPGKPAAAMNEVCAGIEARPGIVDCTVFHGFPFVDTADVGVHVVCTTDGDPDAARRGAREVAAWIWANRERFRSEHHTPEGAVHQVLRLVEQGTRPVVVNETNDNPGGGAPGDATHLLRAMVDAGLRNACFACINDAEVVRQAISAGVGAEIDVKLGGKHDDLHGEPLAVRARVKAITDGRFTLQKMMAGVTLDLGPACRLQIGGIDVVVTSKPFQTIDDEVFLLHGIDVRRYDVIGLKSSQHFRAGFRDLAGEIVTSDAPGLTTERVEVFERTAARGPLWPKDPDAAYEPAPPA